MTNPLEAASEERAKIVAYMRAFAHNHLFDNAGMSGFRAAAVLMAANEIERGEHDYVDLPRMTLGEQNG